MNIKLIVNDKPPRSFSSTDEARIYLDALDDVAEDLAPEPVAASASPPVMVPNVSEANGLSLAPRDAHLTPRPNGKKNKRIGKGEAYEVWRELSQDGTVEVTSSSFKHTLIGKTNCTHGAAQTWITKLNKEEGAGIILDGVRTQPR